MRKLTSKEEGKLIELVWAFAEDHARFMIKHKEDPSSLNILQERMTADELGGQITAYVESLL